MAFALQISVLQPSSCAIFLPSIMEMNHWCLIFRPFGDCCAPELRPELDGIFIDIDSSRHSQRLSSHSTEQRKLRQYQFPAILLLLFVASCAWSQQVSAPEPAVSSTNSTAQLSEAPEPAGSAATYLAPGAIFGAVEGKDGEAYAGVHVALDFAGSNPPPAESATTDDNGDFRFATAPAGPFKLTFSSSGFVTETVTGVLVPGGAYDAHAVVLPVANANTDVLVTASRAEIAQAQLNIEEHQRVMGVIPNYYVTYDQNPAPLTTRQKYQLAWKSSIDPVTWIATGAFAGIEQADNTFAYGQGAQGYAKRYGALYADDFIGDMLGGAVLPSLLHQDPRYFYKGTGSTRSRVWYALYNSVMCKGDNGRWQVNYSAIIGGLAAGGISNLYYPPTNRNGAALTFEGAGIGFASSAFQNLMQEFVIRKLTPHARWSDPGLQ